MRRIIGDVATFGLLAVIIGGVAGHLLRDRWVATAILMYLPLIPASLVAVAVDLARGGRALPRARFLLALIGLVSGIWAAIPMIGSGTLGVYSPADSEVTVLHWNVMWGGGPFQSQRTWAAQRSAIMAHEPDIIILSELPPPGWVAQLMAEIGPNANRVGIEHDTRSRDWFRLSVCSRWPIQLQKRMPLPGGVAMSVTVKVRHQELRLLIVDGKSDPFASRLPFLGAIDEICRQGALTGRPVDLIAGDFNTPSRSIGFDPLFSEGYTLASRSAAGWRGTFPSWLPLYDIDHVWLRPGLRLRSCTLFNGPFSDHRGQFVTVLLTKPEVTAHQAGH